MVDRWQRGKQVIEIVAQWPYGIWWKKPGEKRLRWTRKSKFYLWRHGAIKDV